MSALPFPLHKDHKKNMKSTWKFRGIIFQDDYHFEYVYNIYIHETHCDLCNKEFSASRDRQLEHDHTTGEIRNIVCTKCNQHKKDYNRKGTNTGEDYITRCKNTQYKNGYCFYIRIKRDATHLINTRRATLEEAIIARDEFIAAHPEIYP